MNSLHRTICQFPDRSLPLFRRGVPLLLQTFQFLRMLNLLEPCDLESMTAIYAFSVPERISSELPFSVSGANDKNGTLGFVHKNGPKPPTPFWQIAQYLSV